MNKVVLMGRLTRDPDIRYSQGERATCVARYTLAVDRRFRRDEGQAADFISCVAFGKAGEFAERYLRKGTKIALSGRIQTGSYTNREGVKVYTTEVVAEEQEFAESKAASQNYSGAGSSYGMPDDRPMEGPASGGAPAARPTPVEANGTDSGFMTIPDGVEDELPFI